MQYKYKTKGYPVQFYIDFTTRMPARIRLVAKDANPDNKFTYYTNRYNTVHGKGRFVLNMPLSPDELLIQIYDDQKGNTDDDSNFIVEPVITTHALPTQLHLIDYFDPTINSYIKFIQEFCHRAGNIADKSLITSNDQRFVIQYLDVLKNKDGSTSSTPARIGANTGNMQVNRVMFMKQTVPMRMAIMLHEFSHFWINKRKEDETEADINALMIYLALGYPRIEAYNAFLKVFHDTPNLENKNRYLEIKDFIQNFDKGKYQIDPNHKAIANKQRNTGIYY